MKWSFKRYALGVGRPRLREAEKGVFDGRGELSVE